MKLADFCYHNKWMRYINVVLSAVCRYSPTKESLPIHIRVDAVATSTLLLVNNHEDSFLTSSVFDKLIHHRPMQGKVYLSRYDYCVVIRCDQCSCYSIYVMWICRDVHRNETSLTSVVLGYVIVNISTTLHPCHHRLDNSMVEYVSGPLGPTYHSQTETQVRFLTPEMVWFSG